MDMSEALEELTSSVMSFTMKEEEEEPNTPPSTPAEKSLPEQILDIRFDEEGNKYYLVKWFGFSLEECTWETESHFNEIAIFSPYLLDEYNKRLRGETSQEWHIQACDHVVPDTNMAVCVDFGTRVSEYEFATSPEEVLGVVDRGEDHDFLVKWHGMDNIEVIPRNVANQIWPEVVIKYYEENLIWRSEVEDQE